MCGISGFISQQYNEADLNKMTSVLAHRGPDNQGAYFNSDSGIGLGHRRLSILDLSDSANQPFFSRCNNFIMVYNGEVYNHKEIIGELQKNSTFIPQTSSDTEVILEAFVVWGNEFVNKLNGMFSIAIWDVQKEVLTLFRDRMGIKPLYLYKDAETFAFASEIKAIVNLVSLKKLTVNQSTVVDILHLGYSTSEKSIFNEIKKVKAGSILTINKNNKASESLYWDINSQVKKETINNEQQAKKELKNKLIESVEKRIVSDVPIGTFLSGGIDSSLVTAITQSLSKKSINTFSIGFKDTKQNESEYARKVAKELKTNHHEFMLTEKDAIEQVDNLFKTYDEPFGDSSSIPTLLVSKMAKKHISVALSGDGGDEQFLGYGMYTWAKRMDNNFLYSFRKPISKILKNVGNSTIRRGAMVINAPSKNSLKGHIFSQEQYLFSIAEISSLLKKHSIGSQINENWTLSRPLNAMESQAFYDLKNYLKDDLLVKVDRASMQHSLEVRVPLLDHNVVAYSLNIAPELKYKNGTHKHILKEVLYDYLPSELFARPKKGFSIPMQKWLKTDLNYLIGQYLSKEKIEEANIVNHKIVETIINRYMKGEDFLYNRIWILIQIHKLFDFYDLKSYNFR